MTSRPSLRPFLAFCSLLLVLAGCAYIPQPFPIFRYGPDLQAIPERQDNSTVQQALAANSANSTRSYFLALRGNRMVSKERKLTGTDILSEVPRPVITHSRLVDTVGPPPFIPPKENGMHYFNFRMSKDFYEGLKAFLAGDGETSVACFERVLAVPDLQSEVGWQASMHLVYLRLMMGRPDLAEADVARSEAWELKMCGNNVYSRALRCEVRYWAGDFEGAINDAKDVLAAIGDWSIPSIYPSPPRDQVDLFRVSAAKIRAMTILGMLYTSRGKYREAMPWLEQAARDMSLAVLLHWIPLYTIYITSNHWEIYYGQGWALTSLATGMLALDPESKKAEELFVQGQRFFDTIGYTAGKVLIESFKAQALLATGRFERAAAQASVALELARRHRMLDYVWRLEALRGEAQAKMGRWAEAETSFRAAQTIVDMLSGTMGSDKAKVRFGVGKEAITHNLARIDQRRGDYNALFQDLERGRARAFVSMLASRAVAVDSHRELTGAIHDLDREIQRVRQRKYGFLQEAKPGADAVEAADADPEMEERLLARRKELVDKLHAVSPDLAEAYAVSAVELPRVQRAMAPGDLMAYALPAREGERLSLLLVTPKDARVLSLPVRAEEFSQHLRDFVGTLWGSGRQAQLAALAQLRADLAVEAWGAPANVFFVPSGDMHFVPWGALDLRFTVGVLPTGGWVLRSPHKAEGRVKACVLGDPEYGGALPQLPDARGEALALARMYGADPLVGDKATEAALRGRVGGGVDVLHLATHALYDPLYPLQSSLILTDGIKAMPLTAEQLYKSPLASRLVVLSACETGMGQVVSGDDLLGLTRSFYLGGANVILSSLWPVSDEATRLFMEVFHAKARGGDYGRAWLAARDAVRERGYTPAEYGAFILGGMPVEREAFAARRR
jgi:tetratricopeptide (TPR) repeat protein